MTANAKVAFFILFVIGVVVFWQLKSINFGDCFRTTRQELKQELFQGYHEATNNKIPDDAALESLSVDEVGRLYHSYVENMQVVCNNIQRMGNLKDGGWWVCADKTHRPSPPCLVYSFGINKDFTFDDDVAESYGCMVHSFDPSMNTKSYKRSEKVMFHDTGIGNFDGENKKKKWRMRRLGSIMEELGHKKEKLAVLKMDVESSEWEALPEMLASGSIKQVSQLLLEYHVSTNLNKQSYIHHLKILRALYVEGFRIFYSTRNINCGCHPKFSKKMETNCQEVHMFRIN